MKKYQNLIKKNNEKLLNLSFTEDAGLIINVSINGDFFIHPEEGVILLEEGLKNIKNSKKIILNKLESIITRNNLELVGISADTIADAFKNAELIVI